MTTSQVTCIINNRKNNTHIFIKYKQPYNVAFCERETQKFTMQKRKRKNRKV